MFTNMCIAALLLALLSLTCKASPKIFSSMKEFALYTGPDSPTVTFVKFYAPWCGHCKAMAEDWNDLAAEYEGNDQVTISSVDCTEQKAYCSRHDVRGFPTLKLFVKGHSNDFKGRRDIEAMQTFLKQAMRDPVQTNFVPDGRKTQFLLLSSNHEHGENFRRLADQFHLTDGLEFINEGHPTETHRLLISNRDSPQISVDKLDFESMKRIVELEAYPLWNDLTARNFAAVNQGEYRKGRKLLMVAPDSDKVETLKSIAGERTFRDAVIFGDTDDRVLSYFHIEVSKSSGIAIFDPKTHAWWAMDGTQDLGEQIRVVVDGYRGPTGGKPGFLKKIKHGIDDLWETISMIGDKHPLLMIGIVGIPLGLVCCLCYAICFMTDTTEYEEEDERLLTRDPDSGEVYEFETDRTKMERVHAARDVDENLRARHSHPADNSEAESGNEDSE